MDLSKCRCFYLSILTGRAAGGIDGSDGGRTALCGFGYQGKSGADPKE